MKAWKGGVLATEVAFSKELQESEESPSSGSRKPSNVGAGTELWSSERATCAPNWCTIAPAPPVLFLKVLEINRSAVIIVC